MGYGKVSNANIVNSDLAVPRPTTKNVA